MGQPHSHPNELSIPEIGSDPRAVEALRVWALPGEQQQFSVQPLWDDPGAWGLLFADLSRYLAYVYAQEGHNSEEVLFRILQFFNAEMQNPTDVPGNADNT